MRYLVTGGAGFIGSHLVRALLAQGADVCVIDDFSTGRRANIEEVADRIEVVEASVTDADAVRRAAEAADGIYHLAAVPSVPRSVEEPVRTLRANVEGFVQVLLAARAGGVRRVVLASSSSVYGGASEPPVAETARPNPLSPYAAQKLMCEHLAAMAGPLYGVEAVSVRYFNVFGPRQDPASEYAAVVPRFVTALLGGEPPTIYGDGLQSRDFTYVETTVAGTILAMGAPAPAVGQVYNVACGERITLLELVEQLAEITGSRGIRPVHTDPRPGDVRHSQAAIAKARRDLGFAPGISVAEGLGRTVAWYRDQR